MGTMEEALDLGTTFLQSHGGPGIVANDRRVNLGFG